MTRHPTLALVAAAAALACPPALAELSDGQLSAAERVFVGEAECEFRQRVSLHRVQDKPGHFVLQFKTARYHLVPEETTTGAVRLEDKAAGIVWIQIPAKSMLLNSRLGQRLVDACVHAEQRAEAAAPAGEGIGVAQANAAPRR